MSPAQWRQIQRLFDRALDLDAAERDRFLRQLGREDETTRRIVVSLLAANAEIDRIERLAQTKDSRRR
jgi:hypothetical protein